MYDLSRLHVIFRLGEQLFATPARQVREVTPYHPPTPVPRAPDFVAGLVNHHGRVYVLVELGGFLQLRAAPGTPTHFVLLSREDVSVGFPCDGVLRIAPLPASASEPLQLTEDGPVLVVDVEEALLDLQAYFG